MARSRYRPRFWTSKIDRPASTTVMCARGRSSESLCASSADVMPPPMMQMSDSWTIRRSAEAFALRTVERLGFLRRDLDRPAHLALDQRAVAVVVRLAAPEMERHQIGDHVLTDRPRRQRSDA